MVRRVVLSLLVVLSLASLPGCACTYFVFKGMLGDGAGQARSADFVGASDVRGWRLGERWVCEYRAAGHARRQTRGSVPAIGELRPAKVVALVSDTDRRPIRVRLSEGGEEWDVDVSEQELHSLSIVPALLALVAPAAFAVDVVTSPLQGLVLFVLLVTGNLHLPC